MDWFQILRTRTPYCLTKGPLSKGFVFRLNIPPFVPARTVLEGLESEDSLESSKPVKNEIVDTKVKEPEKDNHFSHHHSTTAPAFSNTASLYAFTGDLGQGQQEGDERAVGRSTQTVSYSSSGGGQPG